MVMGVERVSRAGRPLEVCHRMYHRVDVLNDKCTDLKTKQTHLEASDGPRGPQCQPDRVQ